MSKKLLVYAMALVMLFTCVVGMSVNVCADTPATSADLSTETPTTTVEQSYTLKQSGVTVYTDKTQVKVAWELSDIAATFTRHMTWDTKDMKWVEAKEDVAAADVAAKFTFTNYSSVKMIGKVTFAAETAVSDTLKSCTFDNASVTLDTAVKSDKSVDADKTGTNAPQGVITATLKFDTGKFAEKTAQNTAAKYGTYTVTVSKAPHTLTIIKNNVTNDFMSPISDDVVISFDDSISCSIEVPNGYLTINSTTTYCFDCSSKTAYINGVGYPDGGTLNLTDDAVIEVK